MYMYLYLCRALAFLSLYMHAFQLRVHGQSFLIIVNFIHKPRHTYYKALWQEFKLKCVFAKIGTRFALLVNLIFQNINNCVHKFQPKWICLAFCTVYTVQLQEYAFNFLLTFILICGNLCRYITTLV